jgi:LysM repeat protein
MLSRISLFLVAALALAGCNPADKEEAHFDDSRNPYYKQAQQDLDANNPSAAVADYEQALGVDPKLAGAHYELGIIYGDKLTDPVGSIYHFKRYLELQPNSDKAEQVKTLIDRQSQVFAASLPNSPAQNAGDYAKLQSENASLRKQVEDATQTITQLQAKLTQSGKHHGHPLAQAPDQPDAYAPVVASAGNPPPAPVADSPSTPPPATNAPPAVPLRAVAVDTNAPDVNSVPPPPGSPAAAAAAAATPSTPSRTYTVVKGDSPWKIAHKMYPGDTKNGVDKIMAANPGVDGRHLKIGQVLVIP